MNWKICLLTYNSTKISNTKKKNISIAGINWLSRGVAMIIKFYNNVLITNHLPNNGLTNNKIVLIICDIHIR